MDEEQRVLAAIAALQGQRALLGDAIVDTALAPLQVQLSRLRAAAQQLRQVSVLFLDVVGSTALSQHLDPEDVSAVMDGVLARGTAIVTAHRGRVLQYAGDNLLAAFGSEKAEEDDAERAVLCGLALLDEGRRLGRDVLAQHGQAGCDVRVGIHTGPVLLGGGVDEDGTIRGLTVNIAARMEQTAPHGALRISHDTWLLVRGAFEAEPQPPLQVKGRDEPIQTYLVRRALPAAERVMARGIDGVVPPLTGRDAELGGLLDARDKVAASGRARAVTLVAEAGVGKSRLLAELRARLAGPAQRWWLLAGRTHPNTRLQPYGLLRDVLARQLQIADNDSLDVARERFEQGLVAWLPEVGDEPLAARVQRLGQLLGLDFSFSPHLKGCSPQQLRRSAMSALAQWLRALAAHGGGVAVLLEDLHWADDASLDAWAELLPGLTDVALIWVATARPELLEARPQWAEDQPAHQLLRLAPLNGPASGVLANELLRRLQGDPAHGTVRELLVQRAEGNPFFMEELLRMLRDDGVVVDARVGERDAWAVQPERLARLRLPATLVGVLQARLDRLPAAEREALQRASIIGAVFWDQALAVVDAQAPRQLQPLRQRALVVRREHSSFEGCSEDAFGHHVLQQVTYDTVLKPVRVAGHAAVAAWLADHVGARAEEYLAVTADHYERAGDHQRAFEFLDRASKAAAQRCANTTALEYIERALANPLARDSLRRRVHLMGRRNWVYDMMGRRAEQQQVADEWLAAARELDDPSVLADALVGQAMLASRLGEETRSLEFALQAIEVAERAGKHALAAQALGQVAWVRHAEGRQDEALALARRALASIQACARDGSVANRDLFELQLTTLLGIIECAAGQLAAARQSAARGLALAREQNNRRSECHLLESMATLARRCGQHEQSLALGHEIVRLGGELGAAVLTAWAHYHVGKDLRELGQPGEARARFAQAAALGERCEDHKLQALAYGQQGRLTTPLGAAQDLFDRAVAAYTGADAAATVAQVLAWRTLAELDQGDPTAAHRSAEQLRALLPPEPPPDAEEASLLPLWACHRERAAAGDAPAAHEFLQRVHAALQQGVARIDDPALRQSVLQGTQLYRDIAAAWQQAQPG